MNLYQMEMNLFQKVQIRKIIMKQKAPLLQNKINLPKIYKFRNKKLAAIFNFQL